MNAIEIMFRRNDIFPIICDKFMNEKMLVARVKNMQINKNGTIIRLDRMTLAASADAD